MVKVPVRSMSDMVSICQQAILVGPAEPQTVEWSAQNDPTSWVAPSIYGELTGGVIEPYRPAPEMVTLEGALMPAREAVDRLVSENARLQTAMRISDGRVRELEAELAALRAPAASPKAAASFPARALSPGRQQIGMRLP